MGVRIKICGITRLEDAKVAVRLGVDALGFIFHPQSPRYIQPVDAAGIIRSLPPFVNKVGVFVDMHIRGIMEIASISGIDTVQLHGEETPEVTGQIPLSVIKAFAVHPEFDTAVLSRFNVSAFLLDTWAADRKGGTGKTFDWSIARRAINEGHTVVLAGGLGPTNIIEALENVEPYAVDLNSGLEIRPGIKSAHKMRDVVKSIKSWKSY